MKNQIQLKSVVKFSIIAAVLAAILNLVYMLVFEAVTGQSFREVIHLGSVAGASILPLLVSGVFYFILTKYFSSGNFIFIALVGIFTLASLAGPMAPELPDGTATPEGFAAMTLPMHVISGVIAMLVIPRAAKEHSAIP